MDLRIYGGGYTIVSFVAMWLIFEKAGYKGWYAIIPIYNIYILCKIVFGNGWLLAFLLIPFFNIFWLLYIIFRLSVVFGHGMLFAFGLVFLYPIFILILALGSSYYRGPDVKYG